MKFLFLILFFSLYNLCFSQLSTAMQWEKLYRGSIDSVIVVSSRGYTKEISPYLIFKLIPLINHLLLLSLHLWALL